jgi:hypothetical protein
LKQIDAIFSDFSKDIASSKTADLPNTNTIFGDEAVEPIQPPFMFQLDPLGRNFDGIMTPFKQSKDLKVSSLLLHREEQITPNMLDSLFETDLDQIKMRAAADEIRRNTTH